MEIVFSIVFGLCASTMAFFAFRGQSAKKEQSEKIYDPTFSRSELVAFALERDYLIEPKKGDDPSVNILDSSPIPHWRLQIEESKTEPDELIVRWVGVIPAASGVSFALVDRETIHILKGQQHRDVLKWIGSLQLIIDITSLILDLSFIKAAKSKELGKTLTYGMLVAEVRNETFMLHQGAHELSVVLFTDFRALAVEFHRSELKIFARVPKSNLESLDAFICASRQFQQCIADQLKGRQVA